MASLSPKANTASQRPSKTPERAPAQQYKVDSERYPDVARALSDQSSPLSGQLRELLNELRPPRAPREPVKVIGKLLREYRGEHVAESLVVLDISASGCVVLLPQQLEIGIETACRPQLLFAARTESGITKISLEANLVRFLSLDERGVTLAYKFEGVTPEQAEALYQLANWTQRKLSKR